MSDIPEEEYAYLFKEEAENAWGYYMFMIIQEK